MLVLAGSPSLGFEKIQERIAVSPARARIYTKPDSLWTRALAEHENIPEQQTALAFLSKRILVAMTPTMSLETRTAGGEDVPVRRPPKPVGNLRAACESAGFGGKSLLGARGVLLSDSECRERLIRAGRQRAVSSHGRKRPEQRQARCVPSASLDRLRRRRPIFTM